MRLRVQARTGMCATHAMPFPCRCCYATHTYLSTHNLLLCALMGYELCTHTQCALYLLFILMSAIYLCYLLILFTYAIYLYFLRIVDYVRIHSAQCIYAHTLRCLGVSLNTALCVPRSVCVHQACRGAC